jgi:hypothetical protein
LAKAINDLSQFPGLKAGATDYTIIPEMWVHAGPEAPAVICIHYLKKNDNNSVQIKPTWRIY